MIGAVLILLVALAGLGVVLARSLNQGREARSRPPEAIAEPPIRYSQEVARLLAEAPASELSTLKHLRRQGMQTFLADRDSPLLRALARSGLVSPMGSSAYPADAYPYRVPDEVWAQLATPASPDDAASERGSAGGPPG